MADKMFIKEPGHIYDLFFTFMLYFNKETMIERCINYNKAIEDTEYLKNLSLDIPRLPRELYLFFYLPNGGRHCFITEYYYAPYLSKLSFPDEYNLAFVQNELSNYDKVIDNVIKYYFGDLPDEILTKCKSSIKEISKLISASEYSGEVKTSLFSFFIDPVSVIQKLVVELLSMNFFVEKKFDKYASVLTKIQKKTDFEALKQKLSMLSDFGCRTKKPDTVAISICQAAKNAVHVFCENSNAVILLGENFDSYIDYLINKNSIPDISAFCTAICDKNRVDMLNYIHKNGQVTIKDIENELMLTGTNAYYHISLMLKANILKSRNEGRIIFYSINENVFLSISKIFSEYANKS